MGKSRCPVSTWDARACVERFGDSPRTKARALVPASEYGTEQWREARRYLIGASEMAAVLGISPFASPFSLWWAKHEGWQTTQTMAMYIGHKLEPIIAELFADQRPDLLVCESVASLWSHPYVEWMACSPDYLAITTDHVGDGEKTGGVHIEPVECKSDEGGDGWGQPGTDEVPAHHRVQVLQQCAVFGAPRGHLVRMAGKRFSTYTLEFDAAAMLDVADWMSRGQAFLASLATGVPPEVDDHEATTATLIELFPQSDDPDPSKLQAYVPDEVAAEYERLCDLARDTKARLRKVRNEIRDYVGSAKYARVQSTGRLFADRRVYKRRAYEVRETVVDAIYPAGRNRSTARHARQEESA